VSVKNVAQPFDNLRDVVTLFESWNDNCEFRRRLNGLHRFAAGCAYDRCQRQMAVHSLVFLWDHQKTEWRRTVPKRQLRVPGSVLQDTTFSRVPSAQNTRFILVLIGVIACRT